jgi:hypothetical protein
VPSTVTHSWVIDWLPLAAVSLSVGDELIVGEALGLGDAVPLELGLGEGLVDGGGVGGAGRAWHTEVPDAWVAASTRASAAELEPVHIMMVLADRTKAADPILTPRVSALGRSPSLFMYLCVYSRFSIIG